MEDPTQIHPNGQPVLGGSDPNTGPTLGGSDPSTSITTSSVDVAVVALDQSDWRIPLLAYLLEVLPPEIIEAQCIARCAKTFVMLDDELYKRSLSGVLMKCVPASRGKQILLEVHARIYGHHAAPRSLVRKTFRQGFYWPTALRDAEEVVRRCEGCQFYARQTHLPAEELQTIPITWPFTVWGLDMVGPLKNAQAVSLTYS